MITASIRFFQNCLLADMTCRESELRSHLQGIGILTAPSLITLDNSRTLQIILTPDDETGRRIYQIIDKNKDTLGMLNRLCRSIYCMDRHNEIVYINALRDGKIRNVKHGLKIAEMLREKNIINRR